MKEVLFSVLIPIYVKDNPNHVRESLDSVVNQTITPSEVIIVVDGEVSYEMKELLNHYQELYVYIKIHYFKENRGLGLVLRDGVELCNYEYIARMDADDICEKERFERQIEYINKYNLDIVGSNITEFIEENKITGVKKVPMRNEISKYIIRRNPFNHMTVFFRKSAVLEVGNYESVMYFEDYYLWFKMHQNNYKMDNIQESLVYARTDSMHSKRSGITYIKYELNFQKKLLHNNYISYGQFISNIVSKSIIRILPLKIVRFFYGKFLRERHKV